MAAGPGKEISVFEGVEKLTALLELSAVEAGVEVEPKVNNGFGNDGAADAEVDDVGDFPKEKTGVDDMDFVVSVLVTPAAAVDDSVELALEVGGAPKLKLGTVGADEDFVFSATREPGGVDLASAGVGTVAVEETVTVDSDGNLKVTRVSGFLTVAALSDDDAATEEDVGGEEMVLAAESGKAKPPFEEGAGTGPSTFSPIVKGKPPIGFLVGTGSLSSLFESISASLAF